ncbi:MAG: hypothetical protein P8124_06115 [Gammaproteobacteria bacterium]
MLAACGGGSGGEAAAPSLQTAGIWTGTATVDSVTFADVLAIVDGAGNANIVLQRAGTGDSQFRGTLVAAGGTIQTSVSSLSLFDSAGNLNDIFSVQQGAVVPAGSLAATLSSSGSFPRTATLNLAYDNIYDRPVSLSLISGIWGETHGTYTITLAIDGAGTVNGSDTNGCVYSGTVRIPDPAHDLYALKMDIHSCYNVVVHASGQGVMTDTGSPDDTLTAALTGAVGLLNTDSFVYRLTRQ